MTPEETVDAFIAHVTAGDLDGASAFVAADLEYDNVPIGKVVGPDGMKGILGPMLENFDETEWVIHRQLACGSVVMNERTDRFRNGETWMELPVVGVFEIDDAGKIALWRDYFDMPTMTTQLREMSGT